MPNTFAKLASPAFLIRQNALYKGVLGPSRVWKLIALVVFGRGLVRRFFGKQPEHLGIEKLAPGQSVTISAIVPPSKQERRALRRARR